MRWLLMGHSYGGIIALIGVDTLANGRLVFDGQAGEFTLSLQDS